MAIPAYNHIYLDKAARSIGNMLHDAVYEFEYDGNDFLQLFIQSGISKEIENGNPKYLVGKSGIELFYEVIERTTGQQMDTITVESYDRSDAYWIGWMLAHYQWYSGISFRDILHTIPYDELLGLYNTLHEADIHKSYEVLDRRINKSDSKLKIIRKNCGLTQQQLAKLSGVSINSIRAYERKSKDIDKAQLNIVTKLCDVLKCEISDLIH